jgi:hypothetical protein
MCKASLTRKLFDVGDALKWVTLKVATMFRSVGGNRW